ncbi:hypothetical protein FKM82_005168 [Ascaphus truei]
MNSQTKQNGIMSVQSKQRNQKIVAHVLKFFSFHCFFFLIYIYIDIIDIFIYICFCALLRFYRPCIQISIKTLHRFKAQKGSQGK